MREVVVGVAETHMDRLDDVVEGLRAAGLANVEVRRRFGLVHGDAAPERDAALAAVDGVRSYRTAQTFGTRD